MSADFAISIFLLAAALGFTLIQVGHLDLGRGKFGRTTYLVHPKLHRVFKFFPQSPVRKGDIVLIGGFVGLDRCRVVSNPKIAWSGMSWELRGSIRVVPEPTYLPEWVAEHLESGDTKASFSSGGMFRRH